MHTELHWKLVVVQLPKPSLGPGMITTFIFLPSRWSTEVVNPIMWFGNKEHKEQQFYISVEQKYICTSLENWRINPETELAFPK